MSMFSELARQNMGEGLIQQIKLLEQSIADKKETIKYPYSDSIDLTPLYDESKNYTSELLKVVEQLVQSYMHD